MENKLTAERIGQALALILGSAGLAACTTTAGSSTPINPDPASKVAAQPQAVKATPAKTKTPEAVANGDDLAAPASRDAAAKAAPEANDKSAGDKGAAATNDNKAVGESKTAVNDSNNDGSKNPVQAKPIKKTHRHGKKKGGAKASCGAGSCG